MNAAQVHLALNHLPVIIPLVAAPILGIALLTKSVEAQKIALWLFVVSAVAAVPAYLTGEPTEKLVKNYPYVQYLLIRDHEKWAQCALIAVEIVGIASLLLLLLGSRLARATRRVCIILLFFLSLIAVALMMQTAHRGGEIRHEEIQSE